MDVSRNRTPSFENLGMIGILVTFKKILSCVVLNTVTVGISILTYPQCFELNKNLIKIYFYAFKILYDRKVQGDAYFYSCQHHGGGCRISSAIFSGSSGPGGTDLETIQVWLMKFGEDSTKLLTTVETFVGWLANGSPTLAAYRAFMSGHLIALEK